MGSNDLPMKKIYIDSKFTRHDSVSNSNFKIELPYWSPTVNLKKLIQVICR